MADISVDLSMLQGMANSLSDIVTQFDNSAKIATADEAAIGAPSINDAMHSFATNWTSHREDLVKSIQSVFKLVVESHKTYVDTDNNCAKSITSSTHHGKS